jgi:phosphatidylinositol glycan class T
VSSKLQPSQADCRKERWTSVTHALGGLFCAGLGPSDDEDDVSTFGPLYPPARNTSHGG